MVGCAAADGAVADLEVRYTSAMDDLVLLWIPFGLMLIVAAVALMFVVMRLLA